MSVPNQSRLRFDRREGFEARIILLYILAFAAGGVIQPFLNLYLLEVGLSGTQIGVILGWAALLTVIATPVIGHLADRTQRHRLFFSIITFIKGISAPLILLSSAWLWLAFTVTLRVLTAGASDALLTPLTFVYLREKTKNRGLGSIRFWGVAGFSSASLLAGFLAKGRSVGVMFPLAAVLGALSILFVRVLPRGVVSGPLQDVEAPFLYRADKKVLAVFVIVFIFSLGFSGPDTFGNIYLADVLGAGNAFIGLVGALGVLFQLPGFLLADRLNARFGELKTLLIGIGLTALGWVGFFVIHAPVEFLPFAALQGVGRALYTIGLFALLQQTSQERRAATDLMIANMTLPGLAGMAAKPLSGLIYDSYGGLSLFLIDIVLLVLLVSFTQLRRMR